ncbi:MAG: type II secretion system GspH family protein [bacterium]|nr:type II secretion system GspH family protein [bacterium]
MKQRGFTLPEILITIGVISIVAAILIPQLMRGVQDRKSGAALGKTVNVIETGCQNMYQRAIDTNFGNNIGRGYGELEIRDIYNDIHSEDRVRDVLFTNTNIRSDFFGLEDIPTTVTYSPIPNYNGFGDSMAVSGKLGVYMAARPVINPEVDNTDPIMDFIYIDTNGARRPNEAGRDVFVFGLTDRCHMIPAGSERIYTLSQTEHNVPTVPTEADGCGDTITNGISCTSRVVRNNYRIDY